VFFGEDQGRYVLTAAAEREEELLTRAEAAGISMASIGHTGGTELILREAPPIAVAALRGRHEGWFPRFMGEQ
jgi:phosphoribosylformylglycinamidine synthase